MLVACECGCRYQHRTPACPHCRKETVMPKISRHAGASYGEHAAADDTTGQVLTGTEPEPVAEPVPGADDDVAEPVPETLTGADVVASTETATATERPSPKATRAEWEAYVAAVRPDRDPRLLSQWTKAELVAAADAVEPGPAD